MNIIDSSCWLEFFAGTATGNKVSAVIEDTASLFVPSITLYEVFKKLLIETDEDKALLAVAHMKQGKVITLDSDIAINAARLGSEHKLPMADSIIYATTKKFNCLLWTQDKHFKDLPSVNYLEKIQ
ncbi:MAG TPA: type II toxin-antitoxin system VapC family toxin [Spirochaetota bacterium]|nr:type II toxin-antitoxin system VapC family toxin [Spirochaetota bacterium]HQO04215.1 type II toxin-antitoxin system VapC family toxin [Spirochaetota bacterium]